MLNAPGFACAYICARYVHAVMCRDMHTVVVHSLYSQSCAKAVTVQSIVAQRCTVTVQSLSRRLCTNVNAQGGQALPRETVFLVLVTGELMSGKCAKASSLKILNLVSIQPCQNIPSRTSMRHTCCAHIRSPLGSHQDRTPHSTLVQHYGRLHAALCVGQLHRWH